MKKTKSVLNLKKNLTLSLAATAILAVGCSQSKNGAKIESAASNLVTTNNGQVDNHEMKDESGALKDGSKVVMRVMSASLLESKMRSGKVLSPSSAKAKKILSAAPQAGEAAESIASEKEPSKFSNKAFASSDKEEAPKAEDSLLVAMPIGLLGQNNVFGGVITKVSDKASEKLGGLKLTDLTPLHVKTFVTGVAQGDPGITLFGCASKCTEESAQQPLLTFPIVGIDEETNSAIIDLAPIGKELDLLSMMDPDGEYTELKAVESKTVAMDYSVSTLVFDIKTKFQPTESADPSVKETDFTVRWYLKLTSGSNPAYASRLPTPEVGFFQTERAATSRIQRFSTSGPQGSAPVKYFVKNVPTEYRKAFSDAFDAWNAKFKPMIGKNLISYEYIETTDPRHKELVPGDIRYNILEWDLENKAGYGGLGPSIANQFTGETMSANVLIQGPTIVELYTQWFKVSKQAEALEAQGFEQAAHDLIAKFNRKATKEMEARKAPKFELKLGKKLEFNVRTQRPDLEDPMHKGTFEKVPAGYDYAKYMHGYFLEMVAHELGHNLGLRHNFRGNLISDNSGKEGTVSNSIMEYLGREYRHVNRIQAYDVMAISYGYKGVAPTKKDWFCTDESVAYDDSEVAGVNPECNKTDATNDPFSYFEKRLARGVNMLINRDSSAAPVWKLGEMSQVSDAILGLASYAASAEKTADKWTNFFGKEGRPANKAEVKSYVLARIKKQLCDKSFADVLAGKESEEARAQVEANLKDLKSAVAAKSASLGIYSAQQLNCESDAAQFFAENQF